MRRLLLALLLALGCASDPPPADAGIDVPALDSGDVVVSTDPAPILDRGTDLGAADAPDVVDVPGMDAGVDVGSPEDRPDVPALPELPPVDLGPEDAGTPDAGAADVPADLGYDPRCDASLPDFCARAQDQAGVERVNFCTNLSSNNFNCGGCGNGGCSTAAQHCELGRCRLNCNPGRGDCDGLSPNGCETNTNTSNEHCGRCGNRCPAGRTCTGGGCL